MISVTKTAFYCHCCQQFQFPSNSYFLVWEIQHARCHAGCKPPPARRAEGRKTPSCSPRLCLQLLRAAGGKGLAGTIVAARGAALQDQGHQSAGCCSVHSGLAQPPLPGLCSPVAPRQSLRMSLSGGRNCSLCTWRGALNGDGTRDGPCFAPF